MVGKGLQVLHDGSEVELVACTGKAAQPHTLEAVVCLQVRKAHLDLLALVTGCGELRCTHQGARRIACVLMHVARDLSEGHIRGAVGLERTWTAVAGARAIKDSPAIVHRPGCPEKLTLRADIEVALPIEGKVRARQDAFFPLAHVPNRDVRCDPGADNPMEELASAVRRVGGEPVGLEPQSLLRPLDHRLCRSHLVVSAGWCCLYVDDDRVLDVDQVIEPIAELDALVGFCGPRRARVHRRDHLWRLAISVSVFIIEGRQELCDGARLALGRRPIDLSGSLAMITTGIGFHDARIDCEALALDETCIPRTTASNT